MEYKNNRTANRRRYKSRYHSPHNYKTKRSQSENRAAILVAVATFLVIASLVLIFTFGENIYAFVDGIFHPPVSTADEATAAPTVAPTAAPTLPATEAATEAPTEPPTDAPAQQSDEFLSLLASAGLTPDSLNASQMIFVKSAGTSATVYTYELSASGIWSRKFDPMTGYVGEGGVASYVTPKEMTVTPTGTYRIEYAMGINSDPGTALKYYRIDKGIIWVTNPEVENYNRWILTETRDENIGEWLQAYTVSCPYAVIFDYNRGPEDPAQGSFKLLHVGTKPTQSGGIGVTEADLRSILLWLDPDASPTISIF